MVKFIWKANKNVVFSERKKWVELALLGLPFMALGFYFLYYCLYALFEYVQYAETLSSWITLLPGLCFMSLLSMLFLCAGFYFCATECVSVSVVKDVSQGKIIEKYKKVLFIRTAGQSTKAISVRNVAIRQKTLSTSDSHKVVPDRTYFIVELMPRDNDRPPFELFRTLVKKRAHALSKKICEELEIPLG